MPIIEQKLLFAAATLALLGLALLGAAVRVVWPAGARPASWPAAAVRLAVMRPVQLGAVLLALAAVAIGRSSRFGSEDAAMPLLATGLVVGLLAAWRLSFDDPALLRLTAMAAALATVWLLS